MARKVKDATLKLILEECKEIMYNHQLIDQKLTLMDQSTKIMFERVLLRLDMQQDRLDRQHDRLEKLIDKFEKDSPKIFDENVPEAEIINPFIHSSDHQWSTNAKVSSLIKRIEDFFSSP
ncbi:hypothetical protein V6N13_016615 [Hibiscus sabdariffa]|uniref:Uncharacterized protein n=2 Tax=Hibiscus sabdariffa TaxID=183260 RepID=A0ABR2B994_9ROSI